MKRLALALSFLAMLAGPTLAWASSAPIHKYVSPIVQKQGYDSTSFKGAANDETIRSVLITDWDGRYGADAIQGDCGYAYRALTNFAAVSYTATTWNINDIALGLGYGPEAVMVYSDQDIRYGISSVPGLCFSVQKHGGNGTGILLDDLKYGSQFCARGDSITAEIQLFAAKKVCGTHTATYTATPTWTPTATPTWTKTATRTWTPTASPTASPTGTPTWTPTSSPTATQTDSPTVTETATPTGTDTDTPTPTPTATPTNDTQLGLAKDADVESVAAAGDRIVYILQVQNTSLTYTAAAVTVWDTLDADVEFYAASPLTTTTIGNLIGWAVATINPGATTSFTLTVSYAGTGNPVVNRFSAIEPVGGIQTSNEVNVPYVAP